MATDNEYWAGRDSAGAASSAKEKIVDFYRYTRTTGRTKLWHNVSNAYYSGSVTGGDIGSAGERGEVKTIRSNTFKSNIARFDSIIAGSKPVFKARSVNTDVSSVEQTRIADDSYEYFSKLTEQNAHFSRTRHLAERYGEGHLYEFWDKTIGKAYGTDENGKIVREGNPRCVCLTPMDVVRDVTVRDGNHLWMIVRTYVNKYDYAELFEEGSREREIVLSAETAKWDSEKQVTSQKSKVGFTNDNILLWTLYHVPTMAVPMGRKLVFTEGADVISDEQWDKKIPVCSLIPELEDDNILGYTWAFDMLPVTMARNAMKTIALTNCNQYGNPTLQTTDQTVVIEKKERFTLIKKQPGAELGPLEFPSTPQEVYRFDEVLGREEASMIGLSPVQGGSEEVLKSMPGNAMALLESTTIRYAATFQQNYIRFLENAATLLLETVRDNITGERMIQIAGKDNRPYETALTADKLAGFTGFTLDVGNPALQTVQGNEQLAQTLAQSGMIKTAEEFSFVRETGRIDLFVSPESEENLLILAENEMMMRGEQPRVLATDNRMLHVKKHKGVIANPESRKNEQLVNVVLAHITEHEQTIDLIKSMEMQQGAPPAPEGPPAQVEQPGGQEETTGPLPEMPQNPVTGQQFDTTTGGGMTETMPGSSPLNQG